MCLVVWPEIVAVCRELVNEAVHVTAVFLPATTSRLLHRETVSAGLHRARVLSLIPRPRTDELARYCDGPNQNLVNSSDH